MPSLRAKIFNWYLQRTFKTKPLHLLPAQALRDGADRFAPDKPPAGITLEHVDESGVKGEWHRAGTAENKPTILYIHGGGYVFGSPKSHRDVTFALARESSADVFSLDYRMSPEHLFPAAVDDVVAAYKWLLDQGSDSANLIVAGDSAGGGLALALLLSIKARGMPMPAGAVLFSPWTDLAATGGSLDSNEKTDVMFKKSYIVEGAKRYLGDADPRAPLASPLYGDLAGLPPILTFASTSEVLLDDSLRLHDRLLETGVASTLVLEDGLTHVWPIFPTRFPEAKVALKKAVRFICEQTGGVG